MTKVFSGIRPSGRLHLGNYLGAIRNWIELQNSAEQCVFAVVDLHGITTPYDPKMLPAQINDSVLDFLAAGGDPEKALLIRQSKVPQHAELMWLLSTITPTGWLERLPNWREKIDQVDAMGDRGASYRNNLSMLAYPVLMAADILLYGSDLVPVGEDQLPHIEITNEIGSKFNHLFGEVFPRVKPFVADGARIMSLSDPTKKMSKTGDDGISLGDTPDEVRAKIKRAATDSGNEIRYDEKEKAGISNLLTIYSALSNKKISEIESEYTGKSYSEFKSDLAEVIVQFLAPLQERRAKLASDSALVSSILAKSEEKARLLAKDVLSVVKEKMGVDNGRNSI